MKRSMGFGLAVLALGTVLGATSMEAQEPSRARKPRSAVAAAPETVVDLNKATAADLAEIPGIGEKMAQRILAYRAKNGGFAKVEELLNVSGIGEKKLGRLRPYITVGSKSTPGKGSSH
jgi:competence protein ComEA